MGDARETIVAAQLLGIGKPGSRAFCIAFEAEGSGELRVMDISRRVASRAFSDQTIASSMRDCRR